MVSAPHAPHDLWSVDESSLAALTHGLSTQSSDRLWFSLRREAEQLALVPGFDRLITLDANMIKELPHQIDVATRVLRCPMAGRATLGNLRACAPHERVVIEVRSGTARWTTRLPPRLDP